MTPEQADVHDKLVALLPHPTVRKIVALLRPMPVRKREIILARAVRDGIMMPVWVDQIQIALTLNKNDEARSRCSAMLWSRRIA